MTVISSSFKNPSKPIQPHHIVLILMGSEPLPSQSLLSFMHFLSSCPEDSSESMCSSSSLGTWFRASSSNRPKKINFRTLISTVEESNVFTQPFCWCCSSFWLWPFESTKKEKQSWLPRPWPLQQSSGPTSKSSRMRKATSTQTSNRILCCICGHWASKNNFTSCGPVSSPFCFRESEVRPLCFWVCLLYAHSCLASSWFTAIRNSRFTSLCAGSGRCPLADWSSIKPSPSTINSSTTSCQSLERCQFWISSGSSTRKVCSLAGGPWYRLSDLLASLRPALMLWSTSTYCLRKFLSSSAKSVTHFIFGTGPFWCSLGTCTLRAVTQFSPTHTLCFSPVWLWARLLTTLLKTKSDSGKRKS